MSALSVGATLEARLSVPAAHVALLAAMTDAVQALARLDHDPELLRRLVDQALWDVTQYQEGELHKFGGLRWRTPAAHALARPPWRGKGLRHEHVVERAWAWRLLCALPDAAPQVLANLPAALVLEPEAKRLPPGPWDGAWGWERYLRLQGSPVVLDAGSGTPCALPAMAHRLRDTYAPLVERARAAGADL